MAIDSHVERIAAVATTVRKGHPLHERIFIVSHAAAKSRVGNSALCFASSGQTVDGSLHCENIAMSGN
jgi:hypothetical protein